VAAWRDRPQNRASIDPSPVSSSSASAPSPPTSLALAPTLDEPPLVTDASTPSTTAATPLTPPSNGNCNRQRQRQQCEWRRPPRQNAWNSSLFRRRRRTPAGPGEPRPSPELASTAPPVGMSAAVRRLGMLSIAPQVHAVRRRRRGRGCASRVGRDLPGRDARGGGR